MAVNLSPIGGVAAQFLDNSGNPLSGGKIFTYAAGSTTPQVTYTSSSGAIAHSNPIILDAAGRVPSGEIWLLDGIQYKFLIKTSADVQIGSYDNIVGINSNFVNYTNSQEIQTATAGQTVFTLTTMAYQPGTNSLSVFVDGVNQYGPGASYSYQETNSATVTFTAGLHVGAEVKFTTSAINASSFGDAEQISYTPPFTNSAPTNVELKLAQTVSVKDFGAVGNGIADDTSAIQAAITYCWSQYVRVFPAGIGLTFPAKAVKLIFPDGIYRITSTIDIANGQYEVIAFEAEGIATILWDGGVGSAIRATASTSTGIVTTPISWNGISIRKAGVQKQTGSVAFECERYSNFTIKGMGILGFDVGVWNRGAIDIHYDFDNRAVENCNVGVLTEQKTVSAGIMKPNLLTITNAYFIQCSQHAFWARRNPFESSVNNGTGGVITIENTNFQSDSAVAVNCEYVGEVPGFGSVALRNCWFEGAGNRLIRLNRARALVDSCFLYPGILNEHPISLEVTPTVRSRITFINCDGFVFNSQADNTFTHGFTNSDANTVTNSYVNDVFVTTPVSNYVTNANTAIAAGAGIGHKLYVGQPTGEGDYPRFISDASYMRGRLFYFERGVTATLAPSASEAVLDMGTEAGVWQITVIQSDGGIAWRGSAEVFFNGAATSSVYTKVSGSVSVTVSGSQIVLTNTNPTLSIALSWATQRMAV